MAADYLALGPLIAERLRERVQELQMVVTLQDAADLEERMRARRAAAFVVYDGDRLADAAGRGQAHPVWQRWLVVLAVRNARAHDTGDGLRDEAGPLISALLAALQGWQPDDDAYRPLARVAATAPGYSPAFAFYPLAFECQITMLGD